MGARSLASSLGMLLVATLATGCANLTIGGRSSRRSAT